MPECPVSKRLDIVGQCGDYSECELCDTLPRSIPVSQVPKENLYKGVCMDDFVDLDIAHYLRSHK